MRRLFVLATVVAAAVACNDHPVEPLDKVVTAVNRQVNRLPAKTKIDFLFLVDNSGSMCEEQSNLTRNFRAFSDFLFEELGSAADYRLAVISTDMHPPNNEMGAFLRKPAAPVPSLNCRDENGDPLAPDTSDCVELVENGTLPTIIKSGPDGNIGRDCGNAANQEQCAKDDLERKFRCLATLGTNGDGFEKGLEAMRQALTCGGPNTAHFGTCCVDTNGDGTVDAYDPACEVPPEVPEPEFLRPDAVLVVIFVTDEDDCSDPATNPGASRRAICKYGTVDNNGDGVPDGYQDREICGDRSPAECFQNECGGLEAEQCRLQRCVISRSENSNCEWERGTLTPVGDYRDFLNALKGSPLDQILVASIVGLRSYTESGAEITYNAGPPVSDACDEDSPAYNPDTPLDICCPDGRCRGSIKPSCESENGQAFAGRRYLEFTETFGTNGIGCPPGTEGDASCVNICIDDFAAPLQAIRDKVAEFVGSYCLDKPPACRLRGEDGLFRSCETAEELANTENYQVDVQVQCLLAQEQGGNCAPEDLGVRSLSRQNGEFEFGFDDGCPGGAYVALSDPPPAGAEVFLEFQVEVVARGGGGGGGGEGDGQVVNLDQDAAVGP